MSGGINLDAKNVLGLLGGILLASCLIPQLWRMAVTRSAKDLSYVWSCWYVVGLALTTLYLVEEGATVGWICICLEEGLAILVLVTKIYLDVYAAGFMTPSFQLCYRSSNCRRTTAPDEAQGDPDDLEAGLGAVNELETTATDEAQEGSDDLEAGLGAFLAASSEPYHTRLPRTTPPRANLFGICSAPGRLYKPRPAHPVALEAWNDSEQDQAPFFASAS